MERIIDKAKLWKMGDSLHITIPYKIGNLFKIKDKSIIPLITFNIKGKERTLGKLKVYFKGTSRNIIIPKIILNEFGLKRGDYIDKIKIEFPRRKE